MAKSRKKKKKIKPETIHKMVKQYLTQFRGEEVDREQAGYHLIMEVVNWTAWDTIKQIGILEVAKLECYAQVSVVDEIAKERLREERLRDF